MKYLLYKLTISNPSLQQEVFNSNLLRFVNLIISHFYYNYRFNRSLLKFANLI